MVDMEDHELLRSYAVDGSEDAFAAVVSRHVNLVYSVALRRVGNPHQAEEITQAVFVILARKAHALRQGTLLPGWLHRTAWFASDNFLKTEIRRRNREREAGNTFHPSHDASDRCCSGKHVHCSCDTCF